MSAQSEIVRYIDSIARDKEIDREDLFVAIEQAVAQALAKKYGLDDLELYLDRQTGQFHCNYEISLEKEGRILAQTVKQTILSKVREAERDVLYEEYEAKIGHIVNGTVQRFEGDTVIVNLGRNIEAILPRAEKVRSEIYNIGDRIRALVLEVKKAGPRLKIILSRAHRDLVRSLFELEVPEIADGIIDIRRIEREAGYRTKLAVHSSDPKVDCVGACVGVRGTRIKSIIDELNGERIDIIRWNDDPEILITNALKPAEVSHITLDHQSKKALVLVDEDQLSLGIGRRGQNVRLASKLTGWDIDIMTRAELEKTIAEEDAAEAEALAAEDAGGEDVAHDEVSPSGGIEDAPQVSDATSETDAADAPAAETSEPAEPAEPAEPEEQAAEAAADPANREEEPAAEPGGELPAAPSEALGHEAAPAEPTTPQDGASRHATPHTGVGVDPTEPEER